MRIIPAIDILGGKCVRLTRGDYATRIVYNEDPLEVARMFEDNGLKYLHLVDLDGAKNSKISNYRIIEKISSGTGLVIDFGGGIRTDEDIRIAFSSGARQVTAGTISVTSPTLFIDWLNRYGNDKIILGADSRDRKISTHGWSEGSGEDVVKFISGYVEKGIKYSICTDVNKDGMLGGSSAELYKEILGAVRVNLIASGGIGSMKDIEEIKETGCEGVIVGKAIYEGRIKLREIRDIC